MTKVLMIGLDGVPLTLIQPWAESGDLPTFRTLMTQGTCAHLKSTIPHTSGPAWTSLMTGQNPGKTGVYDFLHRRSGTYTFYPNDSQICAAPTLWRLLSVAGKRVAVINVPLTYPVEPVNGMLISGFLTPYSARDFVHPPEILEELEERFGHYEIYPLATFSERNAQAYFDACHRLVDFRTNVAQYLMRRDPWDFFMTVYFDTDRVQHQLWHYLDATHPWRDADRDVDRSGPVLRYFQHLDASIARLIETAGEDTLVMVLSDHGMGVARSSIVLNTWLLQQGLLRLKRSPLTRVKRAFFRAGLTIRNLHQLADRLGITRQAEYRAGYFVENFLKAILLSFRDVDWSRSVAYSFGRSVGPIYLNVKGREPHGIVSPGREYVQVRNDVAERARSLVHPNTGEPLVGEVLYREDVYHGPYLEAAPDLILQPRDPADKFYGLSDFGSNRVVQPMYRYSGMHRQHGMVIMAGPSVTSDAALQDVQIVDIAPTVLHALRVPIPAAMDGRPLHQAFIPSHPSSTWSDGAEEASPGTRQSAPVYSREAARQVEARLRKLGYMG
jgi:predicted AlkP superfamily phosphohydrolase/phosphomutase